MRRRSRQACWRRHCSATVNDALKSGGGKEQAAASLATSRYRSRDEQPFQMPGTASTARATRKHDERHRISRLADEILASARLLFAGGLCVDALVDAEDVRDQGRSDRDEFQRG